MIDVLIRNVRIVDGTGTPAFKGNIAINNERIVCIYEEIPEQLDARIIINAEGLTALPGFIDIHRHGDLIPFKESGSDEELRQGITSFVNGNCGFSVVPSSVEHFDELRQYAKPIVGSIPNSLANIKAGEFFHSIDNAVLYSNVGCLIGAGALRICERGFEPGPLDKSQLDAIKGKLEEYLLEGALGLSMGLMYVPENFTPFEQIYEMCTVPAKMGKLVTVHMRGEGISLLQSVNEVIELAKQTSGKFHISHLKAAGRKYWGDYLPQALDLIAEAQNKGIDISYDLYPYCAGSTALYTLLPPSMQAGGIKQLLSRLADPAVRSFLKDELACEHDDWDNIIASTYWESVTIVGGKDYSVIGKNLQQIAEERNQDAVDCFVDLLLENEADVPMVIHSMSEKDMELAISGENAIIISDSLYAEGSLPHPRRYGTFAHAICTLSHKLGLERVVRSCTSLPAARMCIPERGQIKEGFYADIVLINENTFRDTANYVNPISMPIGIANIIVNGKEAYNSGTVIGSFGKMIK